MADFKIAHKRTAFYEGGYANDPADRGGETWRGIARNIWPHWEGWKIIDASKNDWGAGATFQKKISVDPALNDLVDIFYIVNFWGKVRGDEIKDQEIANNLFDAAVNNGDTTAIKMLQEVLNLPETGKMDNQTLHTLNGEI